MTPLLDKLVKGLIDPELAAAQASLAKRQAAVACVFQAGSELEILLMQRAERPGDRWSGQISFPGGHAEEADQSLKGTAVRETQEEVGLDLSSAKLLGCLPARPAKSRGKPISMSITPYIFGLEEPRDLVLGPEATSTFWLPFEQACSGALDDTYPLERGSVRLKMPAWRFAEQIIWGMTYEMLQELKLHAFV